MPKLIVATLLFVFALPADLRAAPWWLERLPFNQLKRVDIIGPTDDRGPVTVIGPQHGWSESEIKQSRRAVGLVFCGSEGLASGGLIFDNSYVVTAAHVIHDKNGRKKADCFFVPRDPELNKLRIPLSEVEFRVGGSYFPKNEKGHIDEEEILRSRRVYWDSVYDKDWAILKLASPVPDAKPFEVNLSGNDPDIGTKLFLVISGPGRDYKFSMPYMPVLTPCEVKKILERKFIVHDCDALPGNSGSPALTRLDGRLVLRGLLVFTKGKDFRPFDEFSSVSHSVMLHDSFLLAGLDMIAEESSFEAFLGKLLPHDREVALKAEKGAMDAVGQFNLVDGVMVEEDAIKRWKGRGSVSGLFRRQGFRDTPNGRCGGVMHAVTFADGFTRAVKGTICRQADGSVRAVPR